MASRKAEKERRFRRKEQERKHFEGPMKEFIKQKYPLIFDEYKAFYEALARNHPDTRDLTKTHTYKTWASSLKQQDPSDILATALRQALGHEESTNHDQNGESSDQQTSESSNHDQNGESSYQQTSEASDHDQNGESSYEQTSEAPKKSNLTFTLTDKELEKETGEATNVLIDLNDMVDIMETVEAEVDSIMAELAADQDLADILNRPVDVEEPVEADEGIHLNPDDDIDNDLDVQPFDYELEVDRYDW